MAARGEWSSISKLGALDISTESILFQILWLISSASKALLIYNVEYFICESLVTKYSHDIVDIDMSFLAATKQLYKWYFPSVCLSVRLSVTPFSPCSHHRIIMKFSGVITMVKSDVHAKGQGQRSKVKVTEVNTQLSRFRTLTPVWIHIWQWNHAHSWKQHRIGALLFFKVIHQISRSHGSKNRRIWPRLGVSGL